MTRVLIVDGPHQGVVDVPDTVAGDLLVLVDLSEDVTRPATFQMYRRIRSDDGDFVQGITARYRWDP